MVDVALNALLREDAPVANLHEGLLYALGLDQEDSKIRGKRIRPALCLVTCEALGGDPKQSIPFAMAVELMHNFFLVHDDIEDGDEFRRDRPSVWKKYGLAHGINIGDFLFTKVFSAFLLRRGEDLDPLLRIRLLELLVDTLEHTHVGQTLDMNALGQNSISMAGYMDIVTNKTAYYLAAPIIGGAMIAGADANIIGAIRRMGQSVGPVFQIVDDTIDLTHGKGRETIGSDIREGKRSFLVAHTAMRAPEAERAEMFDILNLPREMTTDAHIARVADLFDKYGAIEAGRAFCNDLMKKAKESIADIPKELRDTLLGIFDGLLDRKI